VLVSTFPEPTPFGAEDGRMETCSLARFLSRRFRRRGRRMETCWLARSLSRRFRRRGWRLFAPRLTRPAPRGLPRPVTAKKVFRMLDLFTQVEHACGGGGVTSPGRAVQERE
jgi:hypothetical protein